MKKLLVAALALSIAAPAMAQSNHRVRGYVRSDGTYVAPHYQTNPNNSRYDNYSTRGNVNPYTGRTGTVDPSGYQSRRSSYGNGGIYGTYGNDDD